MELVLWSGIFVAALAVMIGGAELFLKRAEIIGAQIGLPSFVIGVLIVGFGTSLPELISSLLAVMSDTPTIVTANAIGSNIANILLIGGVLAFFARRITIDRDLLEAELPFFVISTTLFAEVAFDGVITTIESGLLLCTFFVYIFYLFKEDYESGQVVEEIEHEVRHERFRLFGRAETAHGLLLIVGLLGLVVGAKFVIDAVLALATLLSVPPGAITITAIALGTSLPEMVVSAKALQHGKLSMAVGNIFGSNAFNITLAVGVPGLLSMLPLDEPTFVIGLPVLLASSFIFLVIGLAHRLHRWEGIMFFILYGFFLMQLLTQCCNVSL